MSNGATQSSTAGLSLHHEVQTLYCHHHGWLQSWLRRKLGCTHQAADLAHDTFVRVLGKAEPAALSEPRDAIEEVIEPYLLQQGLILRTPRGRMLGAKAWRHLGLEAPKPAGQADLFGGK